MTKGDIDFLHLPITRETKAAQEKRMLAEVQARSVDFVVLARSATYVLIATHVVFHGCLICQSFLGMMVSLVLEALKCGLLAES